MAANYRRRYDLEGGARGRRYDLEVGECSDDDEVAGPFDIPSRKKASAERLRRWRQSALLLNARDRYAFTPFEFPSETPQPATVTTVGTLLRLEEDTFESSVFKGDWKTANRFITSDPKILEKTISVHSRIALHVAACEGHWEFMEEMVKLMHKEDLGKPDDLGCTALHYAAVGGSMRACKALVKKNSHLTQITSTNGWTPLLTAAQCAPQDKDVVCFLSSVTTDDPPGNTFTGTLAGTLAYTLAAGGFHDVLLHLIEKYPNLATAKNEKGRNILDALVLRSWDFQSGSNLESWQKWIYPFIPVDFKYATAWSQRSGLFHFPVSSTTFQVVKWPKKLLWDSIGLLAPSIKQVRDAKQIHKYALELVKRVVRAFSVSRQSDSQMYTFFQDSDIIVTAASCGIVEIVKICLQMVPDIIWLSTNQQNLLKVAVQNRQENILNLMHNMVVYNKFTSPKPIDEFGNSILHLAAQLAPTHHLRVVSGAALQMQREVQWFKEVEQLVHPFLREMPNSDGKTAQVIFTEQHKHLLEKAEHWMKDTSNSCMVVTALISTVMFAATFTVPGGNNQNYGIPIFLTDKLFMVFAISDALGLIFSSTSLLIFLSIQTARYAEEDFLESLPQRLITGLASLFLAIANMMVAFAATFAIALRDRSKWVAIAVPSLAVLPVTIYALLQLPLFVQMYHSTYRTGIFRRRRT